MSEPYLICHLVRGEAAFDIAEQLECPKCHPGYDMPATHHCVECDNAGFWWIIPTSGHRARPYWFEALNKIGYPEQIGDDSILSVPPDCPKDWPDHYPVNQRSAPAPAQTGADLLEELGL